MGITSRLVAMFIASVFISCGNAYAASIWKLGHTFPRDTLEDQAIQDFAKRVAELSKGKIKIQVYPAMQLGDWTVMQQRVSMGGLEMATQPPSSQADKRISFLYFPYLFKNAEMLRKNMAPDAPFRKDLDQLFIGQNIISSCPQAIICTRVNILLCKIKSRAGNGAGKIQRGYRPKSVTP